MPLRCRVCSRPDAGTINGLLLEKRSARSVAHEFGLSEDTVQRHAARHLARLSPPGGTAADPLPVGNTPPEPPQRAPIDELVEALRPRALKGDPQSAHQYRLALQTQAEARNAAPPARPLADEPEWHALRSRLLELLEPFPDARAALRDALP